MIRFNQNYFGSDSDLKINLIGWYLCDLIGFNLDRIGSDSGQSKPSDRICTVNKKKVKIKERTKPNPRIHQFTQSQLTSQPHKQVKQRKTGKQSKSKTSIIHLKSLTHRRPWVQRPCHYYLSLINLVTQLSETSIDWNLAESEQTKANETQPPPTEIDQNPAVTSTIDHVQPASCTPEPIIHYSWAANSNFAPCNQLIWHDNSLQLVFET